REVHAGGARADRPRRDDVRRGRAGERPQRFTEEDRQGGEDPLGQRPEGARRSDRSTACLVATFASLEGKTALVTGGSRGIGAAIARELPNAGATVVVGHRSGQDEAEVIASETGGRAGQADVSNVDDAKRLVDEAGDVDVLVNNAGITRDGVLARMTDDDWRSVLETNLSSTFYTCRAVTRGMMKRRAGSIINLSSIVGLHGIWGQTNYAASKGGIVAFTKSLPQAPRC